MSLRIIEVLVDSEEQNSFTKAHMGKSLGLGDILTSLNGLEKCEGPLGKSWYQSDVPHWVGLGLKIGKTRRINSSQSLGSCMSLQTLEKIRVEHSRSTN